MFLDHLTNGPLNQLLKFSMKIQSLTEKKIEVFLVKYLSRFHDVSINTEQSLIETGIIDSFGYLEMIQSIEDHFRIEFKPNEMTIDTFRNINSIARAIKKKIT